MIDMSVKYMTNMSYLLFAVSGVFAIMAVVLFFTLDIAKCWRMVSGRKMQQKIGGTVHRNKTVTKKLRGMPTEEISKSEMCAMDKEIFSRSQSTAIEQESVKETVLLDCAEEHGTEVLSTISLEIIQDIVYMQDTIEISKK